MPLRYTPLTSNSFYHIYNRGNNKQNIFLEAQDFERFLEKVTVFCKKYPLKIYAYCLMNNHFHFLVKQLCDKFPINRFFASLTMSHASYFNAKYSKTGHVFQNRFQSRVVKSTKSFLYVSRYIHLNPIKDKILDSDFIRRGNSRQLSTSFKYILRDYEWSSYKYYYHREKLKKPEFLDISKISDTAGGLDRYARYVESEIPGNEIRRIEGILRPWLQQQPPGG
jgi:putative transposase